MGRAGARENLDAAGLNLRDQRLIGVELRSLEDQNTKLKRLLAYALLDNAALKELLGKKW
jgi:hypothetical protein